MGSVIIMLFFYFYSIYDTILRNEYENKVKDENTYNEDILTKTKENMFIGKDNFLDELDSCCKIFLDLNDELSYKVIKYSACIVKTILSSILNFKFDKHLLKLILNIKLDENISISNYVVSSFFTTKLIHNLILVSSSAKAIKDNIDLWKEFIKESFDNELYDIFINNIYINGLLVDGNRFLFNKVWSILISKNNFDLKERYQNILQTYCNYLNHHNPFEVEKLIDVPYFKTNFFDLITEKIDSFENLLVRKYYFLFNHHGFQYNRICNTSLIDLYKNKCYKSFTGHINICETDYDINEIDISYLEGKEFRFQSKDKFEYVMGLLQYVSCRYKKHIICLLERGYYDLKVINASDPPFEMIFNHFKEKNNITQEIQDNYKEYADKYFVSILEQKEYRFFRKRGDMAVLSKCFRLTCSHILGNELLREYILDLSQKCYLCNKESEIDAYFEIKLYSKC